MAISKERLRELAEQMAAIMQEADRRNVFASQAPSNVVPFVLREGASRETYPPSEPGPVNSALAVSPGYEGELPSWRVDRCLAQAITMLSVIYGGGKDAFSAWSDEDRDTYLWTVHDKVVEARAAFEQLTRMPIPRASE